jgi:gliding motility-associated lipoprotein GldD
MKLNKLMLSFRQLAVFHFIFSLLFSSCSSGEDEVIAPKPRTYFRLSFPQKQYVKYDGDCPFSCEIPVYSKMNVDADANAEPCWLNLDFPSFHGRLHLSYKPVNGNVNGYLEQTYTMTSRHQIKASGIEEQLISKDSARVYGLIYNVEGNAASPLQFFLTDSTNHFLRGALYFYAVPNIDSIKPVADFIQKDIYHMIETFQWKDVSRPSSPRFSKSTPTVNHK